MHPAREQVEVGLTTTARDLCCTGNGRHGEIVSESEIRGSLLCSLGAGVAHE
jgi:hypothetical protein